MLLSFVILTTLFLIGAAVGSFTSVVIYRLHSGKKGIIRGRSKCPECDTKLSALDMIPIVSYLTLRGQCRYCNSEISYMYPMLELVTGCLFILLFAKFPFLNNVSLNFSIPLLGLYLLYAFYTFILIFTFFFDLRYFKVADEIILPGVLVGLIATIAYPQTPHIFDALIGSAIAAGFFGLQAFISRGKWIGLGDIRVGALMGVILGWKLTIVALIISYLVGSVVSLGVIAKKRQIRGIKIPFAPILVTGTFITIFFGEEILVWYLKSLGI